MTDQAFDTDIAIIGAGMVGATAALYLAQRLPGLRIRLLDRQSIGTEAPSQPSFDQRSTAVAAGSFEALRGLELEAALADVSGTITEVQVSDKGHWGHARMSAATHGLARLGRVVPNAALGRWLMAALARHTHIQLQAPIQVARLVPLPGGYRIDAEAGSITTRLLVLADGANDGLKQQLGIASRRHDYGQLAAIANVQVSQPHAGRAFERFTPAGPMALLPLADPHRLAMVWTLPAAQAEVAALPDAAFCRAAQQSFGDRLGNFLAVGKRDCYPLALREASEQVRAHLVLLGNAAHFLHPVAGQGFNLSVRDLVALADVLAAELERHGVAALGRLAALENYQQRRARDQWLTVQYSHQLVGWFSSDDWFRFVPRQVGLMALQAWPGLKQLLAEQSMGRGFWARTTARTR